MFIASLSIQIRRAEVIVRACLASQRARDRGRDTAWGNIVSRFTERFDCKHPFACAGMAFAGMTTDLALAMCRGGGVGAIGAGFTPAEQLLAIIQDMRQQTTAHFNINAQIRVCAEECVPPEAGNAVRSSRLVLNIASDGRSRPRSWCSATLPKSSLRAARPLPSKTS